MDKCTLRRSQSATFSMNPPNELKTLPVSQNSSPKKDRTILKKITNSDLPSNIRVVVRCRPLLPLEMKRSTATSIHIPTENKITIGNDRIFNFDMIYNEKATQDQIFISSFKQHLDKSLEGYNFSTFAYGQTGAGKSYTMGTLLNRENDKGLIQLSVKHLFNKMKDISQLGDVEYLVKTSFIEIYNDDIRDLLNIKTPSRFIQMRDSPTGAYTILSGVAEINVNEPDDVLKINFIDLAGSEKIKKSGATGDRFKEAVSINTGLLSLGKVIMALAEESKRVFNTNIPSVHIPYRESKLTRILKESLGGNSISVMISCISPSVLNIDETISTLNYSSFAKIIKIEPHKAETIFVCDQEELVEKMKREIAFLQSELDKFKGSYLESETINLKGIIKVLRSKNVTETSPIKRLKTPMPEIKEEDILSSESYLNLNEILDDGTNYEIELSNKMKENIQLREENERLKAMIAQIEQNETSRKSSNTLNNDDNVRIYDDDDIKVFNPDLSGIFLGKPTPFSSTDCKTPNEPKIFSNNMSTVVASVQNKIKRLKEFQQELRNTILESEINRKRLLKNKNEEITHVRRDMYHKTKRIKQMEKIVESNQEIIHNDEMRISFLTNELRTTSQELRVLKSKAGVCSPVKTQNTFGKSVDFSLRINLETTQNLHSKETIVDCKKNRHSLVEDGYTTLRNLMKMLDDALTQKQKLTKKLTYTENEKKNFLDCIRINEEKFNKEIKEQRKLQNHYENLLVKCTDEKEKMSISNKLKFTLNKIANFSSRLDNLDALQENTLRELLINEESLHNKILQMDELISETKRKLSDDPDVKQYAPIASKPNEGCDCPVELNDLIKEREEQLVFIELDNIVKENTIKELERKMKESTVKYENKLHELQFEIETSGLRMSNKEDKSFFVSQGKMNVRRHSLNSKDSRMSMINTSRISLRDSGDGLSQGRLKHTKSFDRSYKFKNM